MKTVAARPYAYTFEPALAWVGTVGFVGVLISSVGPFVVSLGPIGQFRIPQLLPGMPWPEARSTELWCAVAKGKPMRPCDETFWFFRWGFSAMAISSAFITMGLARTREWSEGGRLTAATPG